MILLSENKGTRSSSTDLVTSKARKTRGVTDLFGTPLIFGTQTLIFYENLGKWRKMLRSIILN